MSRGHAEVAHQAPLLPPLLVISRGGYSSAITQPASQREALRIFFGGSLRVNNRSVQVEERQDFHRASFSHRKKEWSGQSQRGLRGVWGGIAICQRGRVLNSLTSSAAKQSLRGGDASQLLLVVLSSWTFTNAGRRRRPASPRLCLCQVAARLCVPSGSVKQGSRRGDASV